MKYYYEYVKNYMFVCTLFTLLCVYVLFYFNAKKQSIIQRLSHMSLE